MNPRKLFAYNLYMITGMMLFYMGGMVMYPSGHVIYGILCLGVGIVMFFISIERIIHSMSMMRNPGGYKDEIQMYKERNTAGHSRIVLERKQKIGFVGFGIILFGLAFFEVRLIWIFGICVAFLLFYFWTANQVHRLNRL